MDGHQTDATDNSARRGAVRKTNKKPSAGSGGQVRRGLEGKKATPKAVDRHLPQGAQGQEGQGGGRRSAAARGGPRRRTSDAEWIAGRNPVVEALRERVPVTSVYVAESAERDGRLREVFKLAAEHGVGLLEVSRGELDRLTNGAVHQGLAAKIPAYEYAHADDLLAAAEEMGEKPLIVALDAVTDPRNLGAVVRSAAGFGAHGVVIPERRAASMTASAWKTSAGAAARIPVAQTVNLTRQLKAYQDAGCFVVGLAADGDLTLPELVADADLAGGAARARGRVRGRRAAPAGGGDLRPAGVDPDGRVSWSRSTPAWRPRWRSTRSPSHGRGCRKEPCPGCAAGSPSRRSSPCGWCCRRSAPRAFFLTSERTIDVASHEARVTPDFSGDIVVRTGPVLPGRADRLRVRAIGVEIELGKTDVASLQQLTARYAAIGSNPDAQIEKVERRGAGHGDRRDRPRAGARDPADAGVAAARRTAPARDRRAAPDRPRRRGPAGRGAGRDRADGAVARPRRRVRRTDRSAGSRSRRSSARASCSPRSSRTSRCSATPPTDETQRLIASAIDSYKRGPRVLRRRGGRRGRARPAPARGRRDRRTPAVRPARQRRHGPGGARDRRARRGRGGVRRRRRHLDGGGVGGVLARLPRRRRSTTIDRWAVAGNHDHGSFVRSYLSDLGWTYFDDGEVVDGPGDTRILGVDDPRSSGLGNWQDETGLTFGEVRERLADAACDADEDGDRVDTLLVHDANLGDDALGARLRRPGGRRPHPRPGRPGRESSARTARSATATPSVRRAARRTPSRSAPSCAAPPGSR